MNNNINMLEKQLYDDIENNNVEKARNIIKNGI